MRGAEAGDVAVNGAGAAARIIVFESSLSVSAKGETISCSPTGTAAAVALHPVASAQSCSDTRAGPEGMSSSQQQLERLV